MANKQPLSIDKLTDMYIDKFKEQPDKRWRVKTLYKKLKLKYPIGKRNKKKRVPLNEEGRAELDLKLSHIGLEPMRTRPKAFETVEEMQQAIDKYFMSCHNPILHREVKPEVKTQRDLVKKDIEQRFKVGEISKAQMASEYAEMPKLEKDDYNIVHEKDIPGRPLYDQVEPYTVMGLCLTLDIDRATLLNYEKNKNNQKFFNTVKRAKIRIHQFVEKQLFREKHVAGPIFSLKNNYEWQEKVEINQNTKISVQDMTDDELREFIKEQGKV